MNEYDEYLRRKAKEDPIEIPGSVKTRIEETLAALPEKGRETVRRRWLPKAVAAVACVLLLCFVILPNCSTVYAQALEKVPVIGNLIKVVTIRNYFYQDDFHEMNIDVPVIESGNNEAVDYINKDIDELTKILADRFNKDLEKVGDKGHSAIYVDYEVVTNSETWFTLRIRVHEAAGSGNLYYKYYHIDKMNGEVVTLGDLAADEAFYKVMEDEIRRQMREIMATNPNQVYWVDDAVIGQDFVKLDAAHNFHWNENGDMVIVFDKYEVAPGYMGTPEFVVSKEVIRDHLKEQYR